MSDKTIDAELVEELVEAVTKRIEAGDIPDEAQPSEDMRPPAISRWVEARLRATGNPDGILKDAENDELLWRRLQTDAGMRRWIEAATSNMVGIEIERRIKVGEFVRQMQEDGSSHVRRA